jgi:hypothetical protein
MKREENLTRRALRRGGREKSVFPSVWVFLLRKALLFLCAFVNFVSWCGVFWDYFE